MLVTWSALSFSFVSFMFLSLPFLPSVFIDLYVLQFRAAFYLLFFPHYSHIFCKRMRSELFLLLFPFLLLFFYIVPYPCFSSMSF